MSQPSLRPSLIAVIVAMGSALPVLPAKAHFKLLAPPPWVNEDSVGAPQKGKPCGPGATGFGSDDVQPVPLSNMVTTVHAGDTIKVDIQETVNHPGYFRVSLAENRDEFADPPLTDETSCSVDLAAVSMNAHGNVILDGIAETSSAGANRHIMQDVKLPDKPCDKCTLQVVQVMKDHGPPNCFYYHCADLKILPAEGSTGTAGAAGGAAGSAAGAAVSGSGGQSAGSSAAAGSAGTAAAGSAGSTATAGNTGTAATSGSAGTGTAAAGKAGSGTTTSPTTSAGATAAGTAGTAGPIVAGGAAPAPASSDSGCTVSRRAGRDASRVYWVAFAGLSSVLALRLRRRRKRLRAR